MSALYPLLVSLATVWTVLGIVAVWRIRRRAARRRESLPPPLPAVSVLKPLCGVDNALEDNLRTFFEQEHPAFELVFGIQGHDDPALPLVRRLRAEHPEVRARIVVHDGGRGINPKVSNLRAMLTAASHDVVVISDSNVAVEPNYLRLMAEDLERPGVGLVTSMFAGTGERSLGATLENLHLNGAVAAGSALPTELLDHPVVVGKSMMFRRSVLERLGGFESVANVLAEDYVIGRMFHAAGHAIRLCEQPIRNVNRDTSLRAFFKRHQRWSMIRLRMAPVAFVLEPVTQPLLIALAAPLFGVVGAWPLVWAFALLLARDSLQWIALRGRRGLLRALPLFPLRDGLVLAAWASAFFHRHVTWRGTRVRVSQGTRLYAETEPVPSTMLHVEG